MPKIQKNNMNLATLHERKYKLHVRLHAKCVCLLVQMIFASDFLWWSVNGKQALQPIDFIANKNVNIRKVELETKHKAACYCRVMVSDFEHFNITNQTLSSDLLCFGSYAFLTLIYAKFLPTKKLCNFHT